MLQVIDRQVRALRSRQAVGSFKLGLRQGTYWGIRSRVADYRLGDALEADPRLTELLADTPTRLKKLDGVHQERLINWRYVTCDTAVAGGGAPPSVIQRPASRIRGRPRLIARLGAEGDPAGGALVRLGSPPQHTSSATASHPGRKPPNL